MTIAAIAEAGAPDRTLEYAKELLRKLWITKGIRFEANRRLEKQHEATHLAISTLSVYVICVALFELLLKSASATHATTPSAHLLFPLATIAAPIFILVLEKHTAGKQYLVKADRMQRSALKIQALHSELHYDVATGTLTAAGLQKIRVEYEAILQDFTADHDNIDYLYFQALHPYMFGELTPYQAWRRKVRGRLLHHVDVWAVPAFLIIVPGAMIGWAIVSVISR